MNSKVCILTSVHPPFDARIFYKEAKTLVNAGYHVVLIVEHTSEEFVDGIRIVPLPQSRNRFVRMTKVIWKLFKFALKEKAKVYHFHDPEIIPVGLMLKLFGKKVIYDVHEDMPKQILYKEWIKVIFIRKLFSFFTLVIEKIVSLFFDYIIAATSDIKNRFPEKKSFLIRNFPIIGFIKNTTPNRAKRETMVLIYVGGLSKVRGIKEIIQSMEFIKERAELWLVGMWENDDYKNECERLDGWKYTKYLGFKKLDEIYILLKRSNVGLATLYPIKNYLTSFPVKAFEYMACSLPIVMSDFSYWKEIFKDCALFANPKNPEDIAKKISILLNDGNLRETLGKNGRKMVENGCSWEAESVELLTMYKRLST